jgi:hypothetical protein
MPFGSSTPFGRGHFPRDFEETAARNREVHERLRRDPWSGAALGDGVRRVVAVGLALIALGLMLYSLSDHGAVGFAVGALLVIGMVWLWRLWR